MAEQSRPPFLSVILPCAEAWADVTRWTIVSLKYQTVGPEWTEVILAEDGTPSAAIRDLADEDWPFAVRYLNSPRIERPELAHKNHARNVGWRWARGEACFILDCDCLVHPTFVERIMQLYREATSLGEPFVLYPMKARLQQPVAEWAGKTEAEWKKAFERLPEGVETTSDGFEDFYKKERMSTPALRPVQAHPEGYHILPKRMIQILGGFDEDFLGWGGNKQEFQQRITDSKVIKQYLTDGCAVFHQPHSTKLSGNQNVRANHGLMVGKRNHRKRDPVWKCRVEMLKKSPQITPALDAARTGQGATPTAGPAEAVTPTGAQITPNRSTPSTSSGQAGSGQEGVTPTPSPAEAVTPTGELAEWLQGKVEPSEFSADPADSRVDRYVMREVTPDPDSERKVLFVGPWVGEFGWELCRWQAGIRKLVRERYPNHTIVVAGDAGHQPLYEHAHEFWAVPSFVYGQNLTRECQRLLPQDKGRRVMTCLKRVLAEELVELDSPVEFVTPQRFFPKDQINVELDPSQAALAECEYLVEQRGLKKWVCLFPRQRRHLPEKNWPVEAWGKLMESIVQQFKCGVVVMGREEDSAQIERDEKWYLSTVRTPPERRLDLNIAFLRGAFASVGSESGGPFLSLMCGCPAFVMGGPDYEKRYVVEENPLGTECCFVPKRGYRHPYDEVAPAVKAFLSGVLASGKRKPRQPRRTRLLRRPSAMSKGYEEHYRVLREELGYDYEKRTGKRNVLVWGQDRADFETQDAFLEEHRPKRGFRNFLELGVHRGATTWMLSRHLAKGSRVVGVDVKDSAEMGSDKVYERLSGQGFECRYFQNRTDDAVDAVRELLGGAGIDLLHIDADHTYISAKKDWANYMPMVNEGGIILIHDLDHVPGVKRFWNEIRRLWDTREIHEGRFGIGIVVKRGGVEELGSGKSRGVEERKKEKSRGVEELKSQKSRRAEEPGKEGYVVAEGAEVDPEEGRRHLKVWEGKYRSLGNRLVANRWLDEKGREKETKRWKEFFVPLLDAHAPSSRRKVVLDLGCGYGRWYPLLTRRYGRYKGVDILEPLVKEAREKFPDGDFSHVKPSEPLPLPDRSVDVVWVVTVLQHLTQKSILDFALSECRRVLKPGGKLFAFENTHRLRSNREIAYRSEEDYVRILSAVGTVKPLGKLSASKEEHTVFVVTRS